MIVRHSNIVKLASYGAVFTLLTLITLRLVVGPIPAADNMTEFWLWSRWLDPVWVGIFSYTLLTLAVVTAETDGDLMEIICMLCIMAFAGLSTAAGEYSNTIITTALWVTAFNLFPIVLGVGKTTTSYGLIAILGFGFGAGVVNGMLPGLLAVLISSLATWILVLGCTKLRTILLNTYCMSRTRE